VFVRTPAIEREPMFSPDGRWIAYSSNESGRYEVYVRPFPGPGAKQIISEGGGSYPTWSRTNHELYYGTPTGQIMAAAYVGEGGTLRAEKPRPWAEARYALRGPNRMFDLHPDGRRFAVAPAEPPDSARRDHIGFIFNFLDELRRLAPTAVR
jgi:serine/threonine-protein kinase